MTQIDRKFKFAHIYTHKGKFYIDCKCWLNGSINARHIPIMRITWMAKLLHIHAIDNSSARQIKKKKKQRKQEEKIIELECLQWEREFYRHIRKCLNNGTLTGTFETMEKSREIYG